ncbi:MAG: serine/threonine-protein phosphatase [Acidimicrobiia bacterium]|nr:serine/threonine-protein phosphatase [Acidimicrobiia bacterium]MYC57574.1 serine/threonine-protein phosphatase [Acidimicrobiia bacterium]MYG94864.1 serine/threonine-protein phosphatase [Acidimicrobiia bacterium]MYI31295.1 serine/threonine-protein phosphatase [Acidimicrobiia bacterium]
MIRLLSAQATHKGKRLRNEDSAYASEQLCAVADGLGGHKAGDIASKLVVETLVEGCNAAVTGRSRFRIPVLRRYASLNVPSVAGLLNVIEDVNQEVWEQSSSVPHLRGMSSTLCVLAVVERDSRELLAVVNVGDSRVYCCDDSGLSQITQDHTVKREVMMAGLDLNLLQKSELYNLSRAVGFEEKVVVDEWILDPADGTRYLLCSDGLTSEVSDSTIYAILRKFSVPQEAANALVQQALQNGGRDNVTAVVVDLQEIT